MILCIGAVLTPTELDAITAILAKADFVDGKTTAGWHAQAVKHNAQLPSESSALKDIRALIAKALQRNGLFQIVARPRTIHPMLISRYEVGMSYGPHTDNALMTYQGQPMRSDVSFTLFLSDPETYQGGELVIDSSAGEQAFKLEAGALVLYPASTLHRVNPVTLGVRLVAVSWVQSLVRDPAQRELLFDLETASQSLYEQHGKTREFDLLAKVQSNLLRQWAEL
ncbi:MAG: Fe2+-dependent dioxygenase [Leptolyngbyaceae cyanobacterium SM2_5_2]|nr:Fe2+-dependent dioxygenase [Leptolyngbyaceae cyanobacterium SM2_5_2]